MFEDDNARLIDPSAESAMNPNAKTNDNMYDVAPKCRVPITRRIRMTGNIAHFEAKTSWDPGYGDIVEIFRDDRPFWDEFTGAKTHFKIGRAHV